MDTRMKQRVMGGVILLAIVLFIVPELFKKKPERTQPTAIPDAPAAMPIPETVVSLVPPPVIIPPELTPPAVNTNPTEANDPIPDEAWAEATHIAPEVPAPTPEVNTAVAPSSPAITPPKPIAQTPAVVTTPVTASTPDKAMTPPKKETPVKRTEPALPAIKLVSRPQEVTTSKTEAPKPTATKPNPVKPINAIPPPANNTAVSSKRWAVQMGVFSEQSNAQQLLGRLTAAGYRAYIEPVGGQHRVRIGPFATQAEAARTRTILSNAGLSANVVPAK